MSTEYAKACFKETSGRHRDLDKEWLPDARTEQDHAYARDEKHDRNSRGNLNCLFLVQSSFIRPKLGYLFLLVITEVRVDQPHNTADQQDHSEDDDETLHVALKLPQLTQLTE